MSFLTGINRSASTAWCPVSSKSHYLATATAAGSNNADFDTSAYLESFSVDAASQELSLSSKAKIEISDRVHSLAWGSNGVIASGLPSGGISFNSDATLLGEIPTFENETIAIPTKHSTPVSCLQFNSLQPQIMASGAENSEIFIWNLAKPDAPVAYAPGKSPINNEVITDLQWNCVVPHILGTVSQNGRVIVWDLRNKKPVCQFTDRSGKLTSCKSISWNPKNTMQLVTASEDDGNPVIQVWNLRNTQMPVTTLNGHTQGVWSTSWCPHDDRFLLSTGKENKAICWNVEESSIVHEVSLRSEWNSSIQWNPVLPAVFSVASYQGQVGVYTMHDVNGKSKADGTFETVQSAPTWLRRPAGASFGFGGKLVSVTGNTVSIKSVVSHPEVLDSATKIENLMQLENHEEYCGERVLNASCDEEKEIWQFLGAQFVGDRRSAILNQIGFDREAARKAVEQISQKQEEPVEEVPVVQEPEEVVEEEKPKEDDVAGLFGSADDSFAVGGDDPFATFGNQGTDDPFGGPVDANDPWSQMGAPAAEEPSNNEETSSGKSIIQMAASNDTPIKFLSGTANEQILVKNLLLKNYDAAVDCCFQMDRMADALVIAMTSNDNALWERTQARYYQSLPKDSAIHIVDKLSKNRLRELVAQADIDEWKCTLAIICSYASEEEFSSLCSDLGDLLLHTGNAHAANLCFISANNLDKAVSLWRSAGENENRLARLETLIERICVLKRVVGENTSREAINAFCEFAELLASQGQLDLAHEFTSYFTNESERGTVLTQRIRAAINTNAAPVAQEPIAQPQPPVVNPTPVVAQTQPPVTQSFGNQPVAPIQAFTQPFRTQPVNQPFGMQPIQPVQGIHSVNPVVPAMPTVKPIQSIQPTPPVVQPIQPIKPVTPVAVPPIQPVAPVANIYNPYAKPAHEQTPVQEALPAAVLNATPKEEVKPGRVEIADNLTQAIQQWKQTQANNPAAQKALQGCSADRIEILKTKLRKNEISPEASDALDNFVKAFTAGNKADAEQQYQWLTKNKYSEVSAKVMLGLKKLLAAF